MRRNTRSLDETLSSQQPVESAESCLAYGDPPFSSSHRLDDDEQHVLPMYPVYLSPIYSVGHEQPLPFPVDTVVADLDRLEDLDDLPVDIFERQLQRFAGVGMEDLVGCFTTKGTSVVCARKAIATQMNYD